MDSNLGRRELRLVLAWAELHQDELIENWRLARAGETLRQIETAAMTGLTSDIVAVAVARHGVLRVSFADGLIAELDVLDRMMPTLPQRLGALTSATWLSAARHSSRTARMSGGSCFSCFGAAGSSFQTCAPKGVAKRVAHDLRVC
jgi:hypothetical protein